MAGHRAATSVYATLGAAAATLMVVGGILAGPSIFDCSRDPDGFGACLREKVAESGLIPPDTERVERPQIVSDLPTEPSPPPPIGWMQANANEYEPAASVPVDLAALPVNLAAMPVEPEAALPVEIAVAPTAELAIAAFAPPDEAGTVSLGGPAAGIVAAEAPSSELTHPQQVALVGPEGQIAAAAPALEVPMEAAAVLAQPGGLSVEAVPSAPAEDAVVTPEPMEAPGTLTVTDPAPSEPASVELTAEASVEPAPDAPTLVVEFDPEYPNVLVLPPPASGDDSSFRALQLN